MTADYKAAYERQKKARELAEEALENKSRELFDSHQSLMAAYTKLRDQKAQLLHQEKLASIGQLSAGIAHEINNPTGFVKSNISTLKSYIDAFLKGINTYQAFIERQKLDSNEVDQLADQIQALDLEYLKEDVVELLDDSLEGVERIKSIVDSLKNFARADDAEKTQVSINDCVTEAIKLVGASVKHKVDIQQSLGDIADITGRRGELSQVLLNLITNAADAIDDHGYVKISTYQNNSLVCVSVEDSGNGIAAEDLNRIFDPFYSTKEVGSGTGLGLSISHGIIKGHSGSLTVTSDLGVGTKFLIELPAA